MSNQTRARALLPALGLAILLYPGPSAKAAMSDLTVIVGGHEVFGRLASSGEVSALVEGWLWGPPDLPLATVEARTTAEGGFALAFLSAGLSERRPVPIGAGQRLILSLAGENQEFWVPTLEAVAEAATGQVTGLAPADREVLLTLASPGGGFASLRVWADSAGRFTATFDDALPLAPGTRGAALVRDGGVTWQAQWAIPNLDAPVGSTSILITHFPGAELQVAVGGPAGGAPASSTVVTWDGSASAWLGGRPIQPGASLTVTARSGANDTWTIPRCRLRVAVAENTVSGICEPGRHLEILVSGTRFPTTAGADGRWSVTPPTGQLSLDSPVTLTFPEAPHTRWVAYEPRIRELDGRQAIVSGAGQAGEHVSLIVHRHGEVLGRGSAWVGADGLFRLIARGPDGGPLPRRAGDTWQVLYGGQTLALPLHELTAAADGPRRLVWGRAAPKEPILILANGQELATAADGQGHWQANLDPMASLPPGTWVTILAGPPEGPRSRLDFPIFRVNVQTNGARVRIEGHAGLGAEVSLSRSDKVIGRGGCAVVVTSCVARLVDDEDQPTPVRTGDVVRVVPAEGRPADVAVHRLTAHIDPGGHAVVGETLPGTTVGITFGNEADLPRPLDAAADTDSAGVFDYELSPAEWSALEPGLWSEVYLNQGDGHRLFTRAVLEILRVDLDPPSIQGLAGPGSTVHLSHSQAGGRVRTATMVADDDGVFKWPAGPVAGPWQLGPGDEITLTHDRGTRRLTLEALAAWSLTGRDAIAVLGAPARGLRLTHFLADGLPLRYHSQRDWTDAAGQLVLVGPGLAASDRLSATAALLLPTGDEIRRPVGAGAGRLALPWVGR